MKPRASAETIVDALHRNWILKKASTSKKPIQRMRITFHQTDIISPKLCDDIIDYIAPTLEKYKGCTIIDFHPGTSVWSSKLHDFLQPRRHLLIEPDDRYYDEFIKPLLDQPNSTYRHTAFAEHHPHSYFRSWSTIGDNRSLLDERPVVQSDDAQHRAFDSNVLVTGNLARRYQARSFSYNTKAGSLGYFLTKFVSAALHNDAFHAPGLVRQLWWFPEEAKRGIFPPRIRDKQAIAAGFDMAFSTSEVVGTTPYPLYGQSGNREMSYGRLSRFRALDTLNEAEVSNRMTAANLVVPETRSLLKADESVFPEESTYKSPFSNITGSAAELDNRISLLGERVTRIAEAVPSLKKVKSSNVVLEKLHLYLESIEYPQATQAVTTTHGNAIGGPGEMKTVVLVDLGLRILELQASFKETEANGPDNPSLARMKDTIIAFENTVLNLISDVSPISLSHYQNLLNEEIAANTVDGPFNLQKRYLEPLKASDHDFWPDKGLTLVDMTPRTTNLSVPGLASQAEGARFCYSLLQHLFNSPGSPLPVVLDKMAINAGKDLIPMVPAITDIRKGGRLNPMQMTARMLTHEMIVGLINAFFEWPFKPQNWELYLATESAELDASDPSEKPDEAGDNVEEEEKEAEKEEEK